jgi:hypothetical protein
MAAAVAGLAGLVWLGFNLFPGDHTIIRKRLQSIARLASMPGPESALARLSAANKLTAFFKPNVVINLQSLSAELESIQGADQLREIVVLARSNLQQLQIQFLDMQIEIDPAGQAASVLLTALADVNNEKQAVVQELRFRLERVDRQWFVAQVETVKALGR